MREGSLKAFRRYDAMLSHVEATCHEDVPLMDEHIRWMCQHCIERIEANDEAFPVDKYSRWLGFIQGVLVTKNLISVQTERDITRPWFTKKVTPSIADDYVGVSPMVGPVGPYVPNLDEDWNNDR